GYDSIEFLLCRWAAEAPQPVLEAFAALEAHDHISRRVGLKDATNAQDRGMVETCECACFLQEIRPSPIEGLLVALRSGSDAHGGNAFTEIVRIIFFDCDPRAEPDVFGLVCDAEAPRPHDPQDAIALIEYGTFR